MSLRNLSSSLYINNNNIHTNPSGHFLSQVKNGNIRIICESFSKLTIVGAQQLH